MLLMRTATFIASLFPCELSSAALQLGLALQHFLSEALKGRINVKPGARTSQKEAAAKGVSHLFSFRRLRPQVRLVANQHHRGSASLSNLRHPAVHIGKRGWLSHVVHQQNPVSPSVEVLAECVELLLSRCVPHLHTIDAVAYLQSSRLRVNSQGLHTVQRKAVVAKAQKQRGLADLGISQCDELDSSIHTSYEDRGWRRARPELLPRVRPIHRKQECEPSQESAQATWRTQGQLPLSCQYPLSREESERFGPV